MRKIILLAASFVFISCLHTEKNLSNEKWNNLKYKGADISYFDQLESLGNKYYVETDSGREEKELFDILKDSGTNYIRLRLWVNPSDKWCSLENTVKMAERVKNSSFKLLLDFHYSDTWADPGSQTLPKDWEAYSVEQLSEKVYNYTKTSLKAFIDSGIYPDMVQVGNEVNGGILWHKGKIYNQETGTSDFTNLFLFLSQGIKAVRESCPDTKIVIHLADGYDKEACLWWFENAEKSKLDYDVIGLSYYSIWQKSENNGEKTLSPLAETIECLKSAFSKEVIIAETYYPWTLAWNDTTNNTYGDKSQLLSEFEASNDGQKDYFRSLCKVVLESGGDGVFWWEPDSVVCNGLGTDLENVSWFNFENVYNGTGDVFSE